MEATYRVPRLTREHVWAAAESLVIQYTRHLEACYRADPDCCPQGVRDFLRSEYRSQEALSAAMGRQHFSTWTMRAPPAALLAGRDRLETRVEQLVHARLRQPLYQWAAGQRRAARCRRETS